MKNTKHTEMNDSSIEQDNQENLSQSKRKILTSIGVTSGVVGASALVPSTWVKPAVNSIILPAHAESTPAAGMTTMAPEMTTMAPGDMTMDSRINVTPGQVGTKIGDGAMAVFHISLAEKPLDEVMVTVTADPAGNIPTFGGGTGDDFNVFTFTRKDYMDEKRVTLTAIETAPATAMAMVTIKFAAMGGGYDDEENSAMLTIVNDDNEVPTGLKATAGKGMVKVEWTAPDTITMPARYIVQLDVGDTVTNVAASATADSSTHPNYIKNVSSGLSHTFMNLPAGVMYSCMVVAVYAKDDAAASGLFRAAEADATTSKVVG